MNFKQQYQNEMQNIRPTEEQCERIRAGVYEKIQNSPTAQTPKKRKTPLALKAIAITGASAACLALVATVALKFISMEDGLNYTAENAGGAVAQNYGSFTADSQQFSLDDRIVNSSAELKDGALTDKASADAVTNEAYSIAVQFSEDMGECKLYDSNGYKTYLLSADDLLGADYDTTAIRGELSIVHSNDKTLYIRLEGDALWVYDENMDYIGTYTEIS